jgi:hypothetical protein
MSSHTIRQEREPVSAAEAFDLLECWDRIGIGIRCAYNPFCACPIHHYLMAGERVIERGVRSGLFVHRRLFEVLLQAARDDALPRAWRIACLQHAALPLERLQDLLGVHDPIACHALLGAAQAAGNELTNAFAKRDPT